MATSISRMQFLRGDFSGRTVPTRPPWSLAEQQFLERCDRCGKCISHCPTRILKKGRGGFPVVDFSAGECLFCADCVGACQPGALLQVAGGQPWSLRAAIDADICIAERGVECRSCADPCEARAIRMRLQVGGAAIPEVNISSCNGCGACYAVCPVQAIRMQPVE